MYEFVFPRENGKVKIVLDFFTSYVCKPSFVVRDVQTVAKGKRKWISVAEQVNNDYRYSHTDYDKRSDYLKSVYLEYCTMEEIEQAINQLIESIRPSREEIEFRL